MPWRGLGAEPLSINSNLNILQSTIDCRRKNFPQKHSIRKLQNRHTTVYTVEAKKLLDSFCKDPQNLLHMTGEKSGIVTVAGECPAK